eukprot:PITA_29857
MDRNTNLIVAGDFNLVLHANEKRGGNFTSDPFRSRLEAILQDHDLVDIRPKNRRYTWSNRLIGTSNIMEQLDRFLVSIDYLSTFSIGYSSILNVSTSDHYSITLTLQNHCPLGPIPFKYSAIWNQTPTAKELVQVAWVHHVEGSPTHIWETKLKKRLSQQNKEQEGKLYAQLSQILREEETKWRLKSRQLWLQEGDKNTAYFHNQATVRKLRNTVSAIMDDERNRYSTQESIKEAATRHFSKLLIEDKGAENYSSMLQYMPKRVTQEMNNKLMKEVEEEEVKAAI